MCSRTLLQLQKKQTKYIYKKRQSPKINTANKRRHLCNGRCSIESLRLRISEQNMFTENLFVAKRLRRGA